MKNNIWRILVAILVFSAIFACSAYAGSTRSSFDGYPFESSILMDTVLDYGTRTDGQPVYIGMRIPGVSEADVGWIIFKCIYDESNNFLRKVAANGENQANKVWNDRASYTYDES